MAQVVFEDFTHGTILKVVQTTQVPRPGEIITIRSLANPTVRAYITESVDREYTDVGSDHISEGIITVRVRRSF